MNQTEPYFEHYKGLVRENMRQYSPWWAALWAALRGGSLTLSALRALYQNPMGVAYDAGRGWVGRELRHGI